MSNYEETKKTRRIAAIIYIAIMAFLVGGSYLNQQHANSEPSMQNGLYPPDKPK